MEPSHIQRLHLAIGKAADDLGNYELAMQHFDAADAVRRQCSPFDSAAFSSEIDRLMTRCTPELLGRLHERNKSEVTPVLIIGMPRSGTTLVEQIISAHPEVVGGGELNFWNERGAGWLALKGTDAEETFLVEAAKDYLEALRRIGPKAARITDKMPFNFLWAGLIHLALPRAVFIHCRRTAVDTALSIHQTHFHSSFAFPTGGSELVNYFQDYERLMHYWRRVLPADRFLDVTYEELTRTPEPIVRRIVAACGLTWDDACIHPETNRRMVKTPSKWQTRQPIYQSSIARWKRYSPWLGPLHALVDAAASGEAHPPLS